MFFCGDNVMTIKATHNIKKIRILYAMYLAGFVGEHPRLWRWKWLFPHFPFCVVDENAYQPLRVKRATWMRCRQQRSVISSAFVQPHNRRQRNSWSLCKLQILQLWHCKISDTCDTTTATKVAISCRQGMRLWRGFSVGLGWDLRRFWWLLAQFLRLMLVKWSRKYDHIYSRNPSIYSDYPYAVFSYLYCI